MANATNEAQLDGSQKTQIVDSAGNPVDPTSGSQKTQIVDSGGNPVFPAPVAAADAEVNATATTTVRSRLFGFNGTAWDRLRSGLIALTTTLTGYLNTIPTALFRAVPTTRTEGQGGPFEADAIGNLRIAEQAPPAYENVSDASAQVHEKPASSAAFNAIPYDTITKATAGVIKAAPGNLYRLWVTNDNAAVQAYALVNKATTPATGDTALMYFYVPTKTTMLLEFKFGKRFTTGIGWAQVTTFGAATITTTTADSVANAECS
jgi:hypothetical protein